jgi:kynurenine formamidase
MISKGMSMKSNNLTSGYTIDLSRTIAEDMPVYPGTEQPVIDNPCTIEACGFAEKKITLYSHTGTHMDAPCHIIPGAPGLDELGIGHFVGSGVVIDVSSSYSKESIEMPDIARHENIIHDKDFILLHTGWGRFWGHDEYFMNYPVLTEDAAGYLAGLGIKGIGIDMISIDSPGSTGMQIHKIFLSRNIVIVENLAGLDALTGKEFVFCCFPLKLEKADGSPVRAVAITNK